MKAKLLASATQRSAVMERMQNVASTSAAATKPIPSMTDRSLIRLFLSVALDSARCTLRAHTLGRIAPVSLATPSDLGAAALGPARQLSRTGAARLTDVCITAERGSVSHACVRLGNRKTFQGSGGLLPTIQCKQDSPAFEPLAAIERPSWI